jgi:hypothetical protein
MKIATALAITTLCLPLSALAQLTVEQRQACQLSYRTAVSQCAQGLNFLEPQTRAGAQKACVESAKLKRDVCLAGGPPPTCQESCQAVYDIQVANCMLTFNPSICGTDLVCQQIIQQQQSDCIAGATQTFNECVAACPVQ